MTWRLATVRVTKREVICGDVCMDLRHAVHDSGGEECYIPLSTEGTFLSGSAPRGAIRAARVASQHAARAARAEHKQHTHHAHNAQHGALDLGGSIRM